MALIPDTLNSGDVFILDAGRHIFQWNGKGASRVEKTKALEVSMCVCVCVCVCVFVCFSGREREH